MISSINFPDYLPLPLLFDGARNKGQTFGRTDDKTGIAKQRKTFAFQTIKMNCSFVFSSADAFLFENFYYSKSGLNNSSKWFNMRRRTSKGLIMVTCRFIQPFTSNPIDNSDLFSYKSQLEVIDD